MICPLCSEVFGDSTADFAGSKVILLLSCCNLLVTTVATEEDAAFIIEVVSTAEVFVTAAGCTETEFSFLKRSVIFGCFYKSEDSNNLNNMTIIFHVSIYIPVLQFSLRI